VTAAAAAGTMTSAETLVLLALAVFVKAGKGALSPRAGLFSLSVALLAVFVALLHVEARVLAAW
jgi:hypothetical protein